MALAFGFLAETFLAAFLAIGLVFEAALVLFLAAFLGFEGDFAGDEVAAGAEVVATGAGVVAAVVAATLAALGFLGAFGLLDLAAFGLLFEALLFDADLFCALAIFFFIIKR